MIVVVPQASVSASLATLSGAGVAARVIGEVIEGTGQVTVR
jgi:phosphoribosylaminoimidazole (AIR) synthetase